MFNISIRVVCDVPFVTVTLYYINVCVAAFIVCRIGKKNLHSEERRSKIP